MDASDRRARDSNHGRRPDSPAAGASCTGIVMPMLLKGVPEGHRHRRARGRVPSCALVNIKLPFRMVGACRPELRTPSPHSAAGDSFGSSGPMEVFGRYSSILAPDGTAEGLDRYLTLARQAVRVRHDAHAGPAPPGDLRRPHSVRGVLGYGSTAASIEDVRDDLLTETKAGFKLRPAAPETASTAASTFEVARAVAAAWTAGGTEAVAAAIAATDREPHDRHLWAVVGDLVARLPAADPTAKALTAVQRNVVAIANGVSRDNSLGTALFVTLGRRGRR